MDTKEPAEARIRVLMVDDNPSVLRHAAEVLPDSFEILDTLDSGDDLQAVVAECAPDVVVLDITLPGENGLELAARLTSAGGAPRVVFLTVHQDPDYVRSALAAGALGYVVKMRLAVDLEAALRAAVENRQFISPLPGGEE